jgi:hypothetical protein
MGIEGHKINLAKVDSFAYDSVLQVFFYSNLHNAVMSSMMELCVLSHFSVIIAPIVSPNVLRKSCVTVQLHHI